MIKDYESLRSHFVAQQSNTHELCLPRTLSLFMNKGLAAWIKALYCEESFQRCGQSCQAEVPQSVQAVNNQSSLQAEVVHLLSNMIEHQMNHTTR